MNINTAGYWNQRFGSGDWEGRRGRSQTRDFARAQVRRLGIPRDFTGSILDYGCGLGDAFPVYRSAYPRVKLFGIDLSAEAIARCRARYGHLGEFLQGDHTAAPRVDVILASNVFEHLSDYDAVAGSLLEKCGRLFIVVPWREAVIPSLDGEHVNRFDASSFAGRRRARLVVFPSRGWSQYGAAHWYDIRLKNIARRLLGRPLAVRAMQAMYELRGST